MDTPRNNSGLIIAACILFPLLLFFQFIPLIGGFLVMVKGYSIFKGIVNSPFTGLDNIIKTLTDSAFQSALMNTVKINLLFLAFVMALAYFLALSLKGLNKWLQNLFTCFFLIPLFIPGSVMARIVISWFQGTAVLVSPSLFPVIYAFMLTVKAVGIPTIFMLKTWQMQNGETEKTGFERLMAPVAFVLIQCTALLNSDISSILTLINPLVYKTGDVLDYYIYRTGFVNGQFALAQSAWFIQFFIHLIIGIAVYFLLKRAIRWELDFSNSNNPDAEEFEKPQAINPGGLILPTLFLFFILWFVFKPLLVDGFIGIIDSFPKHAGRFFSSYINYILIYGFTALAGVPISVVLARSIHLKGVFGKITGFFLAILLFSGGLSIHQYLFIRALGAVDTIFAPVFYYIFPVTNSLVLAVIISFKTRKSNSQREEIKVWQPAFVLGLIQFVIMWSSEHVPLLLFSRTTNIPPLLIVRTISQAEPGNMFLLHSLDLFIAILPIGLFLIFRRYITEWILLAFIRIKGR
ncbi:MAG: hypothetical protein GX045_09725 [Clostridiaceae bacterium]|jgi:putative aldouronate transport system permease protein|nr:hypothetical protein [Clostridiaceae bacterium]